MIAPIRFLCCAVILLGSAAIAQPRVCITIDDLPCANCPDDQWAEVTTALLATLDAHRVPAIGFVNEGKLYRDGVLDSMRYRILEQWLLRGYELGNHTFAHRGTRGLSVAAYEVDVMQGEELLRPLMLEHGKELRYFRHPFLQAGATPGYRDSLNAILASHGYTIAPVTFDNEEYIYAWCYEHARRTGNDSLQRAIAAGYLAHMQAMVAFHEAQTEAFVGHAIPQVLLVHTNTLNAAELDSLLTWFEQRGYTFCTLAEALKDPAYALPEATTPYGFSWIRRWQLAAGQRPPWPPEVEPEVLQLYEARSK